MRSYIGPDAQRQQWAHAVDGIVALGQRVLTLVDRRVEIGIAQKEAILNAAQCASLLIRFCVETKVAHLLRAFPPDDLHALVTEASVRLQDLFLRGAGVTQHLDADARLQLSLRVADGGCGVGSLHLRHHAAYVGSWAQCLSAVLVRLPPPDAAALSAELPGSLGEPVAGSIGRSLRSAEAYLATAGVAATVLPAWDRARVRPLAHVQRSLTHARMRAERASLLERSSPASRARLRSCGGCGAGAFLVCAASDVSHTELMDGAYSFALSWRLGLRCFPEDLVCRVARTSARRAGRCGEVLDNVGDHAAVCRCGGLKIYRHSRLVNIVRAILRESGAAVAPTETMVPAWRNSRGQSARLEISYVVMGARHHVDVTLRHPRAARYVAEAAERDGFAARTGDADKLDRYPAIPAAGLEAVQPFSIESFGRLSSGATTLLRACRRRSEERVGASSSWIASALHARWLAQVNVALNLGYFDGVKACLGVVGAPAADGNELDGASPMAWAVLPFATAGDPLLR